ncbi:FprA family A-type flavoprotein [Thermotoga caldifontis]|uniref:FprA family A-type flavoprotein n=1 Tax=Thermotoga caldifontis TaxID=1508419 RepID=UPI0005976692|nr:FprA family A-type flavoprotein [Thermotoga caldifontis]
MVKVWIEKVLTDPEVYLLRIDDGEIKYFEASWDIPEGISYNAYLVKLNGANVLIDGWKKNYSNDFLKALSSLIDPKDITHIIVNHSEPDHSGTLPDVLNANKNKAKVIASNFAKKLLESFYGITNVEAVSDDQQMRIGEKTFRFVMTPWLHWPDTMVTYLEGVLFGCDVGGGYSLPAAIDDSDERIVEEYLPYVTKYIVTVIGHYKSYIVEGAKKLSNLDIKVLLPGHGLIWKKDPQRLLQHYVNVANGVAQEKKILVVYDSMYGFVENVMNRVLGVLKEKGYNLVVHRFTDQHDSPLSEILKDVPDSRALVFGVSTYEADIHPKMRYVLYEIMDKANYEKPVLFFGVHGWAASVELTVKKILKDSKFKFVSFVETKGGRVDEERMKQAMEGFLKELE